MGVFIQEFDRPFGGTPGPSGGPPEPWVPVVVDGVPRGGSGPSYGPPLARCVYFSITADEPNTPFVLDAPGVRVPFLMLGLQGIVFQPVQPGPDRFDAPWHWDNLVRAVESLPGFSVEFEYFWVPVDLLDRARGAFPPSEVSPTGRVVRGDVFRLGPDLFGKAWATARQGTDFKRYSYYVLEVYGGDNLARRVEYSPEETRSLHDWSVDQFAGARIG